MGNILQTNLIGMILGSQVVATEMTKQGYGVIYSMEGLGSNNMVQSKTILYGTTKHALTLFMRGLSVELEGTGMIAGRLSPGMMLTEIIAKTLDGQTPEVISDPKFRRVFNILAERPETVARFFVRRYFATAKTMPTSSGFPN